jgi:hypothetical protein
MLNPRYQSPAAAPSPVGSRPKITWYLGHHIATTPCICSALCMPVCLLLTSMQNLILVFLVGDIHLTGKTSKSIRAGNRCHVVAPPTPGIGLAWYCPNLVLVLGLRRESHLAIRRHDMCSCVVAAGFYVRIHPCYSNSSQKGMGEQNHHKL